MRQYCIYHLVFKGIIAKADGTDGRYVQNMATLELKTKQKNILSKKKKKKRGFVIAAAALGSNTGLGTLCHSPSLSR